MFLYAFKNFKFELSLELANLIDKAYDQFDAFVDGKKDKWPIDDSGFITSSLDLTDSNSAQYKIVATYESKIEDTYYKFKNKSLGIFGNKTSQDVKIPFGFVATRGNNIYVVFRGTRTPLEWFDDVTIKQIAYIQGWGKTTLGFKAIYDELSGHIIDALQKLYQTQPNSNIFVTGHSLGGALATLCVPDILSKTKFQNPILYTFASPRTVDVEFAKTFRDKKIEGFRIANTEDIVPTLPLSTPFLEKDLLGIARALIALGLQSSLARISNYEVFEHVGEPIHFTVQKGTIADNHNLKETYRNGLKNLIEKLNVDVK